MVSLCDGSRRVRAPAALRLVAWGAVIGLGVNVLRLEVVARRRQSASRPPAPYTVTLREENSNILYTTAVRSDSARMLGWERRGGEAAPISRRQIELPSGVRIDVDDYRKLRSSVQDPGAVAPAASLFDPSSSCLEPLLRGPNKRKRTLDGTGSLGGYRYAKIKEGTVPLVRWFALDFGCAVIQAQTGLGGGQASQKTLVSLRPGEPFSVIFEVPGNYREVPPSQLVSLVNDAERDDYYLKHRPR